MVRTNDKQRRVIRSAIAVAIMGAALGLGTASAARAEDDAPQGWQCGFYDGFPMCELGRYNCSAYFDEQGFGCRETSPR